jgi:glycosyltransferase involved in cell wall biosynthesis
MRFSVIMPVYLSPYEVDGIKSAKNPEIKFTRAVNSFLNQSFKDAELIIISDGCKIAELLYSIYYKDYPQIIFKLIEKQPVFGGQVRQTGIEMSQGEIITYLDHDDFIGVDHLKIINENFDTLKYGWCFYNDWLIKGKEGSELIFRERCVAPQLYYVGTSMIAHRRDLNVVWGDGYAHDWRMIEKYLLNHAGIRIQTTQYYVCHFHPIDL